MLTLADKKILITGASGFLGSYLAEACVNEGAILYGIDIRLPFKPAIWKGFETGGLEADGVEVLFTNHTFDIIFHLAGGASVGDSVKYPEKDFNQLLPSTLKLIQLVGKYCSTAHFVLFSSAAVYGNPVSLPVNELASINPVSPYGIHKALVENMLEHYGRYHGFKSSVLRVFSAFGEGLRKQLFWDVMCRFQNACGSGETEKEEIFIDLFGTGKETRDFIHCTDVARAAILIATRETDESFAVYNVANGVEVDIETAIHSLFCEANTKINISFTGKERMGDPQRWKADISKLEKIGYTSNEKGIGLLTGYFHWFNQQG